MKLSIYLHKIYFTILQSDFILNLTQYCIYIIDMKLLLINFNPILLKCKYIKHLLKGFVCQLVHWSCELA